MAISLEQLTISPEGREKLAKLGAATVEQINRRDLKRYGLSASDSRALRDDFARYGWLVGDDLEADTADAEKKGKN